MSTMRGTVEYPFSAMVQDTIRAHGFEWAANYYINERGLSAWEFVIFTGYSDLYVEDGCLVGRW